MMMFQKPTRWKSKKYLEWIKNQPCCLCAAPAEPHHLKGVGNMSGGSLKAPDWAVMPLCHAHHMQVQNQAELWQAQWEMITVTLGRAIEEGILK